MPRTRLVPIVLGALALSPAAIAAQLAPFPIQAIVVNALDLIAQQPPVLKPFATVKCTYDWCHGFARTSPNGRFVAKSAESGLRVYDVARGTSWMVAEGKAYDVNWSPRGDMIAFGRSSDGGEIIWVVPVDANTGKARGPAQRVTTGYGMYPAVSPDGQWIAYTVDDSVSMGIAVVPASGGPSRELARTRSLGGDEAIWWSADSRSVYAVDWDTDDLLKLHVDGSAREVIYKGVDIGLVMTADGRHLVLESRDGGAVIDTTGRVVGRFAVPARVGTNVRWDRVLGDSALVVLKTTDQRMLEVRPVAGGPAKRLPLIGESNDAPQWSPDGKRIAFTVRDANGRTMTAVSNVDGSNPKVFRDVPGAGLWSPDSRFLASPSSSSLHQLWVLDVSNGTQRTVLNDTVNTLGNFRWRVDGRGFNMIIRTGRSFNFNEVSLEGTRTKLSDVTPIGGGNFVGTSDFFMRSGSVAVIQPITGGPPRQLAAVPTGTRTGIFVASRDTRWIAAQLFVPQATGNSQIELFSIGTGVRTVLDLPFVMTGLPEFVPGDNSLLALGSLRRPANLGRDTIVKIYSVPLNGAAPRVLADVGVMGRYQGTPATASVSPDGKFVVYTVQPESSTQTLSTIDLRSVIPRSPSRTPRR